MSAERYKQPDSNRSHAYLLVEDLVHDTQEWIRDAGARPEPLSPGTIANRKLVAEKLVWFLRRQGYERCGSRELRAFFLYLNNAHQSPEGRWGNPRHREPPRPGYTRFFHAYLGSFFSWAVRDDNCELAVSPLAALPRPSNRQDQIQPFTEAQVLALIEAAKRSPYRRRDEALVLFLLDTGCRASEVCGLVYGDLDWENRCCRVLGKGNKYRTVQFGTATSAALWRMFREAPGQQRPGKRDGERDLKEVVFRSQSGHTPGQALTRSGVLDIVSRLGESAKLVGVRCSPHTLRHTFATSYLRGGGSVFSLQQLLGHEQLAMTQRYVNLVQADIAEQHRLASPVDRLRRRKR
jgi:site-specific recombinase XerD